MATRPKLPLEQVHWVPCGFNFNTHGNGSSPSYVNDFPRKINLPAMGHGDITWYYHCLVWEFWRVTSSNHRCCQVENMVLQAAEMMHQNAARLTPAARLWGAEKEDWDVWSRNLRAASRNWKKHEKTCWIPQNSAKNETCQWLWAACGKSLLPVRRKCWASCVEALQRSAAIGCWVVLIWANCDTHVEVVCKSLIWGWVKIYYLLHICLPYLNE